MRGPDTSSSAGSAALPTRGSLRPWGGWLGSHGLPRQTGHCVGRQAIREADRNGRRSGAGGDGERDAASTRSGAARDAPQPAPFHRDMLATVALHSRFHVHSRMHHRHRARRNGAGSIVVRLSGFSLCAVSRPVRTNITTAASHARPPAFRQHELAEGESERHCGNPDGESHGMGAGPSAACRLPDGGRRQAAADFVLDKAYGVRERQRVGCIASEESGIPLRRLIGPSQSGQVDEVAFR